MAKDPAVSSIEVDCLQRADMSLPESDDSSPGDHDMDQMEAVARRLSVQVGAPWGIDRIDGSFDGSFDDGDLTGKGVRVYVVDSGVLGSHDDFSGRVVNGYTVRAASAARVQSSECPHTPPPPVTSYSTMRPSTAPHHLTTLNTLTTLTTPSPLYLYSLPTTLSPHDPFPQPLPPLCRLAFTPSAIRAKLSTASSPPAVMGATVTAPTWPRPSAA